MVATLHSGTDLLTEDQRLIALGRVQILRAYREKDVPPARTAQEHDLSLCTPGRWTAKDRRLGLRGRRRKFRAGKDKRRVLPTLQRSIEGLVMRNLDQVISAVVEVECETLAIGTG